MRTYNSTDKYDVGELKKLNAQPWQVELLSMNPDYTSWGNSEDGMTSTVPWCSPLFYDTWKQCQIQLNDLNEIVNFYFAVERKHRTCEDCGQTGYNAETCQLYREWYTHLRQDGQQGWQYRLTADEVEALYAAGRLWDCRHPDGSLFSPGEVNDWAKKRGPGHDGINHHICLETRAKRLNVWGMCTLCNGSGIIYEAPEAHVSLQMWLIHPRKGCSRGVWIDRIEREYLPDVFDFLQCAARRNFSRFSRLPSFRVSATPAGLNPCESAAQLQSE